VLLKYRVVYFSVPKNACTSLKRMMCRLDGKKPPELPDNIHSTGYRLFVRLAQFKPGIIYDMLTSPRWFRFGVVRNPYDRMVSAYKSKIASTDHDRTFITVRAHIRKHYTLNARRDEISFAHFVNWVYHVRHLDEHWSLQTKILQTDVVAYSFIARFERLEKDMGEFFVRTNIKPLPLEVTNATRKVELSAIYTQELADIVYEIYQSDFETFGYARDSWKSKVGGDEKRVRSHCLPPAKPASTSMAPSAESTAPATTRNRKRGHS
jgi:hypothetical protein